MSWKSKKKKKLRCLERIVKFLPERTKSSPKKFPLDCGTREPGEF